MTSQAVLFLVYAGLHLHGFLFLGTNALPVQSVSDMEQLTTGEASSNFHRTLAEKELATNEMADEGLKGMHSIEDLSTKHGTDGLGQLYGSYRHGEEATGQIKGKSRSIQEGKRSKRLTGQHESEGIRNEDNHEARLRRHSLHKRETLKGLSIAAPLEFLTAMVMEDQYNRRVAEENAMRQQLYDLGKRSDKTAARISPNAFHEDKDFATLLQRAFSSPETN
jgi:hypothetical protein